MANSTLRCGVGPNQDMTGRNYSYGYATPAYATPMVLPTPQATETLVKPAVLTGNLALSIDTTDAYIGDKVICLFTADSGGTRTVTFGAGFKPSATLAVSASKFGSASFMFDGVNFVETGRAVTA